MKLLPPLSARSLWCVATLCLAAVPGAVGADQSAAAVSPSPSTAAAATAAAPGSPADLAPLAPPSPEVLAEVAAHAKTAEELWTYIQKYTGTEDLEAIDPGLDQESKMAKVRELVRTKVTHLRPAIDELLKRYPQDPHCWDAKLMRVFFLRDQNIMTEEEATKTLHEVADAADASEGVKRQARSALLEETLSKADPSKGLTDDIEKQLSAYEKDFPDDPVGEQFITLRLRMLQSAPDKVNDELKKLAGSPNKAAADAAAKELKMRTEPLDLKFSTLDGKEIDMAKLRGKVVLIDCWATWCGPCMMKLPEIQAVAKKYADNQDFQLVGVSLDEDKAELEKIVKSKSMNWPQFFDGKGWQNEVSTKLGVTAIPATFLVDKKGFAHRVDSDTDLEQEIGKTLAMEDTKK